MKKQLTLILVLLLLSSLTGCGYKDNGDDGANLDNNNPEIKSIVQDSKTGEELSTQDFEGSYELGKAFLNDYYLQKAGISKIDFSKFIVNENLLKYSNKRISDETHKYDIQEVTIGISEANFIQNEKCFYISYVAVAKDSNVGSFSEVVELLVSNINGKLVISDWYIAHGSGSSSFDQRCRPNATIDSPGIWDDQDYVKSIFEKAGI